MGGETAEGAVGDLWIREAGQPSPLECSRWIFEQVLHLHNRIGTGSCRGGDVFSTTFLRL